jgi:hypothetical protein
MTADVPNRRELSDTSAGAASDSPRVRRTFRQFVVWQARRLLILYLVFVVAFFLLQRMLIFPRHMTPAPPVGVRERVAGLEEWSLRIDEGDVEARYLPGDGCSADSPGPAVIFAHGNAELIDEWANDMQAYRSRGVGVLMVEFRGYGRSAGSPSQKAINQDMLAFYDRLIARPEVDATRIVFHGRSIGGGVVCELARHRKPRAMVLQSTFTSIRNMASRYGMPGFLVADPFDNLAVLSSAQWPLILFHGRHDSIIPYSHAESLAKASGAPLVTYECDHNDCPPNMRAFMDRIGQFLADAGIVSGR